MSMERGIITISEGGVVSMPTAPIWMTQFEIADLFGVFSCDVRKAIHAIYKNGELNRGGHDEVCQTSRWNQLRCLQP